MRKRLLFFLSLLIVALALAGCNPSEPPPSPEAAPKIFKWISSGEDNSINPHDCNAAPNYEIVDFIQVALYQIVPAESRDKSYYVPALAEDYPVAEDDYVWTIKVNPEAKWANGEPIDANTFIYSWKMGLDPDLAWNSTSSIANQYILVKNGLEYYQQKGTDKDGNPNPAVDWEDVGLKALDDYTLEITTAQKYTEQEVILHFAVRSTSPVYEPIYEECMNADRTGNSYGTSLEKFMGCGPFNLTNWVKASERTFEKNENFINAHLIKLDGIEGRVVLDEATRLELFESGDSDYVALGANGLAKYAEDPSLISYDQKAIRTIEVNRNNPDKAFLQDPLVRKAIFHAIDRNTIADLTFTTAAPFFLSYSGVSFADGTLYRQMEEANEWLPANGGYDPDLAKELFDEALEKYNLDKMSLSLHYSEGMDALRTASEYIQNQLPQIFGEDKFELKLQAIQHTAALALMRTSNEGPTTEWDMCWSGWHLGAETYEPHKKFAPYRSYATNKYSPYSNDFLDDNYEKLLTEEYRFDERKTFDATVEIEKSIILDDITCIPVIQEKAFVLWSERIVLPVDEYTVGLGFGWRFMDMEE